MVTLTLACRPHRHQRWRRRRQQPAPTPPPIPPTTTTTTPITQCQVGPSCNTCGFTQTATGCLYLEEEIYSGKNWNDAEATCQEFGRDVRLAALDTLQVGIFMSYQR